jgi:uncharacterized protein (DUF2236 family)
MVWRVDRELAVLLGSGARALLLQVAHPVVAAAVAEHSRYATDPLGRLHGTLHAIYSFAFDDRERASATVARIVARHDRVRGVLRESAGAWQAGAPYRAQTAEHFLWVYATLIDSSLVAYERFVAPLHPHEAEAYYQEMARAGHLWGLPAEVFPPNLPALRRWMDEMMAGGKVVVSQEGREIARLLLRPRIWWLPAHAFTPLAVVAVWLLPPPIREQLGYSWGPRRERFLRLVAAVSRRIVPRLPHVLRDVPWARAAYRRLRG